MSPDTNAPPTEEPWYRKLGRLVQSAAAGLSTIGGDRSAFDRYMAQREAAQVHQQQAKDIGVLAQRYHRSPEEIRAQLDTGAFDKALPLKSGGLVKVSPFGDVEKVPGFDAVTGPQKFVFPPAGARARVNPVTGQYEEIPEQYRTPPRPSYEPFHLTEVQTPTGPEVVKVSQSGDRPIGPPVPKAQAGRKPGLTADDMKKGVHWIKPNGADVSPQEAPTNDEAIKLGAVPLSKDDYKQFKQYSTIEQDALRMLTLFPSVAATIGTKDWPTLVGRAIGQRLRGAQLETLRKRNPVLADYLEHMRTLSLNMTKAALPVGRIPVWDQQLLMGAYLSPEMNAPTQEAQLRSILDRAQKSKQAALLFGKETGGVPAPASSGPAVGTIEDGHRFKGGNPADPNAWEPVQ